jgi:hypothetical protein
LKRLFSKKANSDPKSEDNIVEEATESEAKPEDLKLNTSDKVAKRFSIKLPAFLSKEAPAASEVETTPETETVEVATEIVAETGEVAEANESEVMHEPVKKRFSMKIPAFFAKTAKEVQPSAIPHDEVSEVQDVAEDSQPDAKAKKRFSMKMPPFFRKSVEVKATETDGAVPAQPVEHDSSKEESEVPSSEVDKEAEPAEAVVGEEEPKPKNRFSMKLPQFFRKSVEVKATETDDVVPAQPVEHDSSKEESEVPSSEVDKEAEPAEVVVGEEEPKPKKRFSMKLPHFLKKVDGAEKPVATTPETESEPVTEPVTETTEEKTESKPWFTLKLPAITLKRNSDQDMSKTVEETQETVESSEASDEKPSQAPGVRSEVVTEETEPVVSSEDSIENKNRFSLKMPAFFKKDDQPGSPIAKLFSFPKLKKESDIQAEKKDNSTEGTDSKPEGNLISSLNEQFSSMFRKKSKTGDAVVQTETVEVPDHVEVEVEVAPAAEK